MSWSFEVIFNEKVDETETVNASGISKWIELDTLIFTTRSPTNDINLKIITKKQAKTFIKMSRG